jgi:hypothetical protein
VTRLDPNDFTLGASHLVDGLPNVQALWEAGVAGDERFTRSTSYEAAAWNSDTPDNAVVGDWFHHDQIGAGEP